MHQNVAAFLVGGMGGGTDEHDDRTAQRVLDAAVSEIAASGMGKLKIDPVARRAGVNRATIYRRFGDLDGLIEAVTMREGRRMAETVAEAVAGRSDHRERAVEAFVACLRMAREHPVIARVAALEPQALIEAGMADDAALLSLGGAVVAEQLRAAQADGLAMHLDPDEAGRTVAMLFAACVVMPTKHGVDLRTDESVRAYARRTLIPMIFGPGEAARQ
jgi:AcrR family transcriptional regulator